MADWTAGYVAEIGYTFGYYPELNPLRVKLAFANAGVVCPEIETACELGFGQGVSVNLHAAASGVQWHGNDFNPAQAAFAQELVKASGTGARLHDDAFADFARRADLPDFDYIGLHGIWSWVSQENRACIVDFVRRKLKVGGVLYISYNTLPGWAAFAPMRRLMTQHAAVMGVGGTGITQRIDGALAFAEGLLAAEPMYAKANPQIRERLSAMRGQNREYLAHEFFNRDWHPMCFASMAEELAQAKLSYACSASFLDHVDSLNLSEAQWAFLSAIPDPILKESVRDFMVNQQFRKDYWVKGLRRLSGQQQLELLNPQRVMLTTHRPDVVLKVKNALGEASVDEHNYDAVLDLLADFRPRSVHELGQATALPLGKLMVCLTVLTGMGHLAPVQGARTAATSRRTADRLNAHLVNRSRSNGDISHLASPVTGGGIAVDRFSQLFLSSHSAGGASPEDWAQDAWSCLSASGSHLIKGGREIEAPEENLAELRRLADLFDEKSMPMLRALQIAG